MRDVESIVRSIQIESDNVMARYKTEKFMYSLDKQTSRFLDLLYNAYTNDIEAYKIMYEDMVKGGVDPEKIRDGMESRMVSGQGVGSVKNLKQRYLSPTEQKSYDASLSKVKSNDLWRQAGAAHRKDLETDVYNLTVGNGDGEALREKINDAKKFGLSETEYLLWELALEVCDQPNKNGELGGTPTNEEKANAIEAIGGLSDGEIAFLWNTDKGFEAYAAGVDMSAYVDYVGDGNDVNLDKLIGAQEYDIETETYFGFLDSLKDVDKPTKNGNYGSYTQDEVKLAISATPGLTKEQKAYLYQSINSGWKNNPWK
jgi:hypothetical protein